jgi:8-oxo-dGTP pyrophosphatase MutT (NUDIX family)
VSSLTGAKQVLRILDRYEGYWAHGSSLAAPVTPKDERRRLTSFRRFVHTTPNCCSRSSQAAHLTGSALVVSLELDQVLLTLHAKRRRWLPLGGHADGDSCLDRVAWREVREESGLTRLAPFPYHPGLSRPSDRRQGSAIPLDLGCPLIPPASGEPEHMHYDIRYLILADVNEALTISAESLDLRWFSLQQARSVTGDSDTLRQLDKLEWLTLNKRLQRAEYRLEANSSR